MNVPSSSCQKWSPSRRGHTARSPGNRRPVHALCQVHGLRGSELIHDCKSKACRPTLCSKGQVSLKGRSSGSSLMGSISGLMGVQRGSPGGQNRCGVWEPRQDSATCSLRRRREPDTYIHLKRVLPSPGCHCVDKVKYRKTRNVSTSIQCFKPLITRREHFPQEATSHGGKLNVT